MEQNKDQSGAVASEKPQFPWNPDPINHEWTQPEIAAIHAFGEGCFQAGVSSVQSGAAVRGEAVALTDTEIMEALSEVQFPKPVRLPAGWVYFARAIEKKIAAKVSARAADALDSQPEVKSLGDLLMPKEQRDRILGTNHALDSQPTVPVPTAWRVEWEDVGEGTAFSLFYEGNAKEAMESAVNYAKNVRNRGAKVIPLAEVKASSQPTDGGVRNGRDLKAVHAFLMGESPLEGVQFGDKHPTKAGAFWWRLNLRAALAKG